jgi:hypothetical protein
LAAEATLTRAVGLVVGAVTVTATDADVVVNVRSSVATAVME